MLVVKNLLSSPEAVEVIRNASRTHIPNKTAPWVSLKAINQARFRALKPAVQAGLLRRHYSGLGILGDVASLDLGEYAEKVAAHITVISDCLQIY